MFSVSKTRFEGKVAELRELNGYFLALIESIERVREIRRKKPSVSKTELSQSIDDFAFIKLASQRLYEALINIWSRLVHSGHSANICFDRTTQTSLIDSANVRFDMAFDCLPRLTRSTRT